MSVQLLDEVIPNLYIGSIRDGKNLEILNYQKITRIFCIIYIYIYKWAFIYILSLYPVIHQFLVFYLMIYFMLFFIIDVFTILFYDYIL